MPMTINPSPNRTKPPAFHEMDADAFEEMSCALYEKEPGVSKADLYGAKRQLQYGIDVIAERMDDIGIEVASCKCYGNITKGKIPEWSDDFLKHWDTYWKEKKVYRFVLIVASPVNSTQRAAEVDIEKRRFADIGVTYEVWAPRQLQEKIRHHPGLVSQYLGAEFVSRLCGTVSSVETTHPPGSEALSAQVVAQMGALQQALSGEVEKRLDAAFKGILRGDLETIDKDLLDLRTRNWHQLVPETQARILRLQASLCLQRNEIDAAERLADEADAIAKSTEPRLRALLASRQISAENGLQVLGSPSSRDGVQLQVALLLECGRLTDALELLETHEVFKEEHPETERLRAIAALIQGNRDEAFAAIQAAERLAPDQTAIQRAGGMIRYACALSPLVSAEWYLYPNPLDLDLVGEDDHSRALLNAALAVFETLAKEHICEERTRTDETWLLACLCNLRDELDVAEERCQEILTMTPSHAGAIQWALARGFEFNRGNCIESLQSLLEQGEGEPNQVLALAWLLVAQGEVQEAEKVVLSSSHWFKTTGAQETRDRWLADLAARKSFQLSATPDDALTSGNRLSLLVDHAQQTGNWEPLAQYYKELASTEAPPITALKAAQLVAAAGYWSVIAANLDALLRFETAEAVRIAAFAAFYANRPNLAVQILEERQRAFTGGKLPHDLRVLRIKALALAGDKGAALRHASSLAAESESLSDRLVKADMLVRIGNLSAALPIIREATKSELLSPSTALNLAQVIALEDKGLARSLFRHAKKKGLPENLATSAFTLACRLELEDEASPFIEQMAKLAQEGAEFVRLVTLDEVVEHLTSCRKGAANLEQSYFDGALAVHLLMEHGNGNLGRLYRPTDADLFAPVLVRHGARPSNLKVGVPFGEWHIYLDITALLLAAQLELLDPVEQLSHPISISPSLPDALYELEIKSRHNQPGRVAAMKAILDMVNKGKIAVVDLAKEAVVVVAGLDSSHAGALAIAERSGGLVVDHHLPDGIDADSLAAFITLGDIIDGLFNAGALDSDAYANATSRLGTGRGHENGVHPLPGTHILFLGHTLTVLVDEGLLPALLSTYRVEVEATLLEMAEGEIRKAEDGENLAACLAALRRRVSEGIESGRYVTISACDGDGADRREINSAGEDWSSPLMKCLFDLLKTPQMPNAVVWVDDRYLTGYPKTQIQGNPIVGIYEVINAMRSADVISLQTKRDALMQLRASNAMFIPLEPGEVLDHLNKAVVRAGMVVETPALATIRRYVARILLLEKHLKIDESSEALEGRPLELNFLMHLRRLAETCIVAQWVKSDLPLETRRARSSWIWAALRIEHFSRLPLHSEKPEDDHTLAALLFCSLLTGVIRIVSDRRSDPDFTRRKAYLEWVQDEVLRGRLENDRLFVNNIATLVSHLLSSLVEERPAAKHPPEVTAAVKRYLRVIIQLYPEKIRQQLINDSEFCRKLGIKSASVVSIGEHSFNADRFWSSVAKAFTHRRARVRTLAGKRRVDITRVVGRDCTVRLTGAIQCTLSDPAFQLLTGSRSRVQQLLESNSAWLDMAFEERNATIGRIISTASLAERMHLVEEARDSSAALHYTRLSGRFKKGAELTYQDFRPPAAYSLIKHLRLPQQGVEPFLNRLENAAGGLVVEEGFCFAFFRLSGLPVPTPAAIIEGLLKMTKERRVAALAEARSSAHTPLQLIHLFRLHLVLADEPDLKHASLLLNQILDSWRSISAMFLSVLRWTNAAFTNDVSWSALPVADRLALVWTHADRLTDIFISANVDVETAAKAFADNHPERPLEQMMRLDHEYVTAAGNPELVDESCLLFHGLAYALGTNDVKSVLSDEQVESLCALLSIEAEGSRMPSPWLYKYREPDDAIGSFFNFRLAGLFEAAIDPTEDVCAQALDNVLTLVEESPNVSTSWLGVWALGRPRLSAEGKERLNRALENLALEKIIEEGGDDLVLFQSVGNCCVRLGDGMMRSEVREQLMRAATSYARAYPGKVMLTNSPQPNPAIAAVKRLLEGAAALSVHEEAADSFRQFGSLTVNLAAAWPEAAPLLRDVLENMLSLCPGQYTHRLWESLIILRSFP